MGRAHLVRSHHPANTISSKTTAREIQFRATKASYTYLKPDVQGSNLNLKRTEIDIWT